MTNTTPPSPTPCGLNQPSICREESDTPHVRPHSAITSSTSTGGNVRVNTPTDTRSDNRRSDTGLTQPARGTPPNYTHVTLTERYWA